MLDNLWTKGLLISSIQSCRKFKMFSKSLDSFQRLEFCTLPHFLSEKSKTQWSFPHVLSSSNNKRDTQKIFSRFRGKTRKGRPKDLCLKRFIFFLFCSKWKLGCLNTNRNSSWQINKKYIYLYINIKLVWGCNCLRGSRAGCGKKE